MEATRTVIKKIVFGIPLKKEFTIVVENNKYFLESKDDYSSISIFSDINEAIFHLIQILRKEAIANFSEADAYIVNKSLSENVPTDFIKEILNKYSNLSIYYETFNWIKSNRESLLFIDYYFPLTNECLCIIKELRPKIIN
ncbi:MAG TPA: hypothetical protein PKC24_08740 [Cyclobacteriaceae bacterium]|nr:hypothetical protein [Cyclobacteriaceae bacterium]